MTQPNTHTNFFQSPKLVHQPNRHTQKWSFPAIKLQFCSSEGWVRFEACTLEANSLQRKPSLEGKTERLSPESNWSGSRTASCLCKRAIFSLKNLKTIPASQKWEEFSASFPTTASVLSVVWWKLCWRHRCSQYCLYLGGKSRINYGRRKLIWFPGVELSFRFQAGSTELVDDSW